MLAKENIRLTFGLKLKQIRQEKGISLSELAQKTGISVSYLNEIEKGKKYPQTDKIYLLAESLEVSYDWLVSLKLHKKLAPVSKLLASNFWTEFPLEIFGIEPAQFLEILANAPDKVSAFISTLVEIARNYNLPLEEFYFAVLRSYQEMYDNYFEDIELAAEKLREEQEKSPDDFLDVDFLKKLLKEEFKIEVTETNFEGNLRELRSVLKKKNLLLLNKELSISQKRFVLSREIGFAYLKIKKRPLTFSWVQVNSFEEVLNNFKASYFADALLLPQNILGKDLDDFFAKTSMETLFLMKLIDKYVVTPETLFNRFSNLLPKRFGLNEIFFLRFDNHDGQVNLTKEMHFSGLHNPHASALGENYCNKWVSISLLKELQNLLNNQNILSTCKAQISEYYDSNNKYFVLAMARSLAPTPALSSLAIGIKINEQALKTIHFLREDQHIETKKVGVTCQRCPDFSCKERQATAHILQKELSKQNKLKALLELFES
ncbi:MAG: helix-turn-helix domain-containing protein [Thermonemataceae bacterium]|nr:helix-turn-helix domain-containing protein [Thermonemataceae bacterium]